MGKAISLLSHPQILAEAQRNAEAQKISAICGGSATLREIDDSLQNHMPTHFMGLPDPQGRSISIISLALDDEISSRVSFVIRA